MVDKALVEQFFTVLNRYDNSDFVTRNQRINRNVFPMLASHPELAHLRLPDFDSRWSNQSALDSAAFYLNLDLIRHLVALGVDVHVAMGEDYLALRNAISVGLASTDAYQQAKLRTIETLLEFGADANHKRSNGETPLHEAVLRENDAIYAPIIGLLLRKGADPNAISLTGWAPIHMLKCNLEALDLMITYGGDINLPNDRGETPLMLSHCNDLPALLKYGADVHARDKHRRTVLHYYAWERTGEDIDLLLQAGTRVDSRDRNGYTPLHYSASICNEDTAPPLIAAGANVNALSHRKETPLAVAKLRRRLINDGPSDNISPTTLEGRIAMEAFLREHGAEPVDIKEPEPQANKFIPREMWDAEEEEEAEEDEEETEEDVDEDAVDPEEIEAYREASNWADNPLADELRTVLTEGGSENWKKAQELLAAHPGLAKARFYDLATPLHWCAEALHPDLVNQCLALGGSVNTAELCGYTPLIRTVIGANALYQEGKHRLEVIEMLLKAGADPNRDDGHHTILHLIDRYASDPEFLPLLKMLLRYKADPNRNKHGDPALHSLIVIPGALPVLAAYRADMNLPNRSGETPLILATRSHREAAVRALLILGAKVDQRDKRGCSALHYAAMTAPYGEPLVKILLEGRANPHLKDRRGYTPLHCAVGSCVLESIPLLLAAGADIEATSKQGETPLAIAEKRLCLADVVGEAPSAEEYAETAALLRQVGARK